MPTATRAWSEPQRRTPCRCASRGPATQRMPHRLEAAVSSAAEPPGTIPMSAQQHTVKLTSTALGSRDAHRYPPVGSSGRGALVVLAATVAMAMGFGGLGLITVFMGPMEADLGWSRSETSLGYA